MKNLTKLELKTELLLKGLYLDPQKMSFYRQNGITSGRKGGAGPLGGRYFLFEDESTLVNAALWDTPKKSNLLLKDKEDSFFNIVDINSAEILYQLKPVKDPKYYDPKFKTSNGIEMKKIALVHGTDCLGTTVYQKCKYWSCGEACKFCGIQLSLEYGDTILEKNAQQISEVINAAKKEGRCSHMTLTSGTTEDIDKGAEHYINVLKGIKENYPDLPLHIQIEPLEELKYLDRLKDAGADTIGIHIEILNDKIRKEITPGKYKLPYHLFEMNWKYAINTFGKNQVETFILTGFGERKESLIQDIEGVVKLGVIPFVTPVRAIPGVADKTSRSNLSSLLEIYKKTAKLMKKYGVNPLKNKAGCVRCGGCSSINEAYKSVS
jgi:radical SAM protein (TIGR04043 family)